MDKKIAILCLDDIRHVTMIKIYTEYFRRNNIAFDIICSERYGAKEIKYEGANVFSYSVANVNASKLKKLYKYLEYRKFAISKLQENKYDYIIVWGEHTSVLFEDYLRKHRPYCVNIRDISFPNIHLYYNRLRRVIENSDFSTWCAPNGLKYLPKHDYKIVLNQNKSIVKGAKVCDGLVKKKDKIRIGAVGYIRHVEPSKKLMKALSNDERYIIQFFGTGSEILKAYAQEIGMRNVEFEGTFKPEDTVRLVNSVDVINAYCGDGANDKTISVGSPIRYGYSTLLYKPAIVSPNTYLSKKASELNIAFVVEDISKFADQFYDWYYSLNFEDFTKGCDRYNKTFDDSLANFEDFCIEKFKMFM